MSEPGSSHTRFLNVNNRATPIEDDCGASNASGESELHTSLEVTFDDAGEHRRKSSIIALDPLDVLKRDASTASCFVHSLLENKTIVGESTTTENNEAEPSAGNAHDHATHSRLLTKKQLSEMAWGVRELSKRLGSIRMKIRVRRVFLLTKAHDEELIGYTRKLAAWLLSNERATQYIVYVENTLEHNSKFDAEGLIGHDPSNKTRLRYWTAELCRRHPTTFDFVVTLGGDGTVLYASWLFQRVVPPILSFALGSLGFLTKFDYDQYPEILEQAFRDGVTIGLRLRFECTIMRSSRGAVEGKRRDLVEQLIAEEHAEETTHRPDGHYQILNDVVVDRGPNPTMSSIELFGGDEHFTTVQADGICVATPTGSTAYNLAAGGSLCHPENPVILVSAICAHTLSFRPIILPDTIVLRVGVPYDARTSSWASFDGRERVELQPGDYVTISASRYPFANVQPPGRRSEEWVNSISRTLQWNSRQRQKSFKEWSDN
ncbi:MAG: hypothetical protein M1814_006045 [Vezdaea aestivalis]|nr:MAG: hypothetical protein M1814_006045 [Vezdaea aestivalis]